ncbi:hypothetical protein [Streptomyces antarcticus]|uniref:hypothetical protein n=1 Tax=Streptomyces antarcticus TaxID=2996458 RepID=UPI002270DE7A|nr:MULTISPECIES: hypothetical protein [unclassified Streptomyces]MCY0942361.1 hypothetical protein [Streptomyces sp. H34-AA3]MCZ4080642.1 hypothetical protein [Streptomyces sp. H34-S5]
MPKRSLSPLHRATTHWSAGRRILVASVVIVALLGTAGLTAWFTTRGGKAEAGRSPASPAPSSPAGTAPKPSAGTGSVPAPPKLTDPLAYARAAAVMLWSYDTRTTSRDQQLAGMNAWMTRETKYTDWTAISAQIPDPVLWSRMADNAQHATAAVAESHFPSAFKQALAENPTAITEAYIYAITVTGKQTLAWKDSGGGAEDRAVTLAVQCRPSTDCALVSIAPSVAP